MGKPEYSNRVRSSEEPHIQREIDSDQTGTIRRYLRLADNMLNSDEDANSSTILNSDDDPNSSAA